jgi:four helix bundle protein
MAEWGMAEEEIMGGEIRDVEDMPVYQCLYALAIRVEKVTRDFSADFRWLRGQVLRSSESVCANLTEGFYAQYSTEYVQSLYRCRREARETRTHLAYARDTGVLVAAVADSIAAEYLDGLKQLANLISSIERKIHERGKGKPSPGLVKESEDVSYMTERDHDARDEQD